MDNSTLSMEPMILSLEGARVNARGILEVWGWAAGYSPVDRIEISISDQLLGAPEYGRPRADVAAAYPDYVNAGTSGFFFQQELNDEALRAPEVTVRVTILGGITRVASHPVQAQAVVRRRRHVASDLFQHCEEIILTSGGTVRIGGWAACAGVVSAIDVLLDDEHVGAAALGFPRPDVGNTYPSIPSARSSGFYFETKLDKVDWSGEHLFTLLIHTEDGASHAVPVPVQAQSDSDTPNSATGDASRDDSIRFHVDAPAITDGIAVDPVRGMLTVAGWAIARSGVASVNVFLDDVALGAAYIGMRRLDIGAAFQDWEGSLLSGFAITLPRRIFTKEEHKVRVSVVDNQGSSRETAFLIEISGSDDASSVGLLRESLYQSEIDLKLRLIESAVVKPAFTVVVLAADDASEEYALTRTTLRSLKGQVLQDFRVQIAAPSPRAAALAEIATGLGISLESRWSPQSQVAKCLAPWRAAGRRPFLMVLRAGDRLGVDALLELALELASHPEADFVYADERRYDPAHRVVSTFYKPEWSPDLILSSNYVGLPWCAAMSLLQSANISAGQLNKLGEYDLILRLTECASGIRRVPSVLGERPVDAGDSEWQEFSALSRALRRRKIDGEILRGCIPGVYRLKRRVTVKGLVSIIMPTIGARGLVEISIASIRKLTRYRNFEIICIDNIKDPESDWKPWLRSHADIVVEVLENFNWSRFNNIGAHAARGEFLLFMNDDIEILDPYWLDTLLEHAQQEDVGVVGPQLLYPDRSVQHAGIFLANGGGRHAFRFSGEDEPGPFGLALSQRNMIAVTGACMLSRRAAYEAIGGFNEAHSVVNNDLDYCMRAWRGHRRVVFTPYTKLIHHELASRAKMPDVFDTSGFDADWRTRFLASDPYFHPKLSLEDDNYQVDTEPTEVITPGHPLIAKEKVRRILVQKLDHIGDFITALPAIRRLQERFPKAEIYVLAPKASLSLTYLEPAIAGGIQFDFFHSVSSMGEREITEDELEDLRVQLAPYRFDLAIDLRKQGNTRRVLKYSGAPILAGFNFRGEHSWLNITLEWEGDTRQARKSSHVSDEYTGLIEAVSIACESDRSASSRYISRKHAFDVMMASPKLVELTNGLFDRRYVCIHPASGNDARQWPPMHFSGLIDLLIDLLDVNVVIIGTKLETVIAEAVLDGVLRKDRVWSLVGKTGMADVPHLMVGSALFVGNNSGPHHMAAALGVPTIGVHSSVVDAREWGPLGPRAVALQRRMSCGPCYLAAAQDCHRNLACLRELRPVEVFRQCKQFLALADMVI